MATSPTQRSLNRLRDADYDLVQVVENWIPGARVRRDLFGILDILAVSGATGEVLGVQATSYANVAARVRKIAESDSIATLRKAGWRIEVHGWRKRGARWDVRVVDCS